ncbi:MAG: hypothetical protein ACRENL_02760, partial [Candidatus Dormibacteria bacterium]
SGLLTNLDVASIIGLHNDRSVQQRFAIARMPEQVRAMVRHTPISRKLTELTALAEMKDPLQQMAVAEKIAVGEATSVNQVLGREFKDRNTDRTPAERRDGTVRATLTLEFDLPTPVHRARTGKHGDERAARREGIPAKRVLTHALTASVLEGRVGLAVMFRTVTNSWNRQLITEGWPEKGAPTQ